MSACDNFTPDADSAWLCVYCQFTEIEHSIAAIDEQFDILNHAYTHQVASNPVSPNASRNTERTSSAASKQAPAKPQRSFPPIRGSTPGLNQSGNSPPPVPAKPSKPQPIVPPKPTIQKPGAADGSPVNRALPQPNAARALPNPGAEPPKPAAPKPVGIRAVDNFQQRANGSSPSVSHPEQTYGESFEPQNSAFTLEDLLDAPDEGFPIESPHGDSNSRDYNLDLEMAHDDSEASTSHTFQSNTMPSASSAFGGSTFGTGTFSGSRPSVRRRPEDIKGFGSHRGAVPGTPVAISNASSQSHTPEKRTSDEHQPLPSPHSMESTIADPSDSPPSATATFEDDSLNSASPRNKSSFGFDSALSILGLSKKKDKTENPGGSSQPKGLTKITNVIKGKQTPKENKGLSKEGAMKLQIEQQEERKKREQDFARQLEAVKSSSGQPGIKRMITPARLKRLSRETGVRRPYENNSQSNVDAPLTKTEPTPGPELDKKREYIVKELFSTEQTYVKNLEDALATYYKPMIEATKTQKEIPADLINSIFSNMQVILPLNRDHLLKEMNERANNWSPEKLIGDIFVRFAPFLKMYTQYNDGFDNAMKALETAAAAPWFLQFCNAKVLIESLLINPVQRIPRYTLLLEDLWKNTPSTHPDNENLFKAIGLTKKVAAHVNLSVAKNQNFDKLTSEGLEHLLAAHRILVIDGELTVNKIIDLRKAKKTEKAKLTFKFLVFNDILVFYDSTIKDKKEVRKREEIWPLELTWIEKDLGSTEFFNLIGPGGKKLVVNSGAPEVFERWWQALSQAIDKQLEYTQIHLKGQRKSFNGTAETLEERKAMHTFKNGFIYQGDWARGNMHGKGSCEFMGSVYEGDFELNKKNGRGTLQYSDGNLFEGEFKDNQPNGKGELITSEGNRYEGEMVQGKRSGHGEMLFFNGDRYVGEWKDDHIHGTGTMALANRVTYAGQWQHGLYHGEGTLTTSRGTYFGGFQNGVFNGHGQMKWVGKASAVYEGTWKNGMMHGHGVMNDSIGFYEGDWVLGMKRGKGKLVYKDGSVYDGQWEDDNRHGKGTFEDLNGYLKSYKGEWVRDVKQGRGTMTFTNGATFEGLIHEGLPHGQGILRSPNLDGAVLILDCRWNRGVRDTKCNVTFEDVDGTKTTYFVDDEDEFNDLPLPSFVSPMSWEHYHA